ncbi:MAG: hypothetical protein PSX36_02525 [bacterium]|nr:hypothetical protein [bacterium]
MIQTFTHASQSTANQSKRKKEDEPFTFAEPSFNTIQTILNFSKNLEIRHTKFVRDIEIIKS